MKRMQENETIRGLELCELFDVMNSNTKIVEHFHGDLFKDFQLIASSYYRFDKPVKFLWIVRNCGTFIFNMDSEYFEKNLISTLNNYDYFEKYIISLHSDRLFDIERMDNFDVRVAYPDMPR